MNPALIFLFLLCFQLCPSSAWAGGAVAEIKQRQLIEQQVIEQEIVRRQQQEIIRQYMLAYQQAAVQQYVQAQKEAIVVRAAQEQAAQQFMAQQMAQEIAAYQIASVRRDQVLAQQTALQIKVVQDRQLQQAFQAIQAQQYVQNVQASQAQQYAQNAAVAQMMAVEQQKSLAEYQQALLAKDLVDHAAYEQIQQAYAVKTAQDAQQVAAFQAASILNRDKLYENVPSSYVKDVVSVSDLWASLDKSSKAWPLLIDKKAKAVTISHYMQKLAGEGGKIQKDPMHYAQMIDDMSKQNPSMLLQPLMDLVRIMAIIEYDFDNGLDKNALAHQIFTDEKSFQANKKRLGL